jgi:hypothetical protein
VGLDHAGNTGNFPARQFAFPLPPKQDACAQALWLHQAIHEGHLIDARFQKEFSERRKRLLAQIPATIEVVTQGISEAARCFL